MALKLWGSLKQPLVDALASRALPVRAYATAAPDQLAQAAFGFARNLTPKLFIGGKWVDAADGATLPVVDPRTEETFCHVAAADKVDVDKAVAAARKAFDEGPWPRMSGHSRGVIMQKLAAAIEANLEEFALLETLDNGKPIFFSRAADVQYTVDHFRYFAGWADKIHGKTIPQHLPTLTYTFHEPIGVVGQIIPWNFPLLMAAWKLAPALACGNTVVLKVAEQTPLTALKLAQVAAEVGLPEGVLNILTGYGPTAGAALANHPHVDKLAFTGSTEVGRLIALAGAKQLKPVSLELGGKSPVIVCGDVNVDSAVSSTHSALFFNHGQCCAAGSRVFVHESIYDEFVEKSAAAARERTVGDPFGSVDQGPQIDAEQHAKVRHYIDAGKAEGARVMVGSSSLPSGINRGYYVEPTVFADVKDSMSIARDEIFGPVQCIMKWSTLDEVIKRANDSNYGLAAGVFSDNIHTVTTLTRAIKAGTVWVNTYNQYDAASPFGGYKESGMGRDKGEYALSLYTQVKCVTMPLPESTWR